MKLECGLIIPSKILENILKNKAQSMYKQLKEMFTIFKPNITFIFESAIWCCQGTPATALEQVVTFIDALGTFNQQIPNICDISLLVLNLP